MGGERDEGGTNCMNAGKHHCEVICCPFSSFTNRMGSLSLVPRPFPFEGKPAVHGCATHAPCLPSPRVPCSGPIHVHGTPRSSGGNPEALQQSLTAAKLQSCRTLPCGAAGPGEGHKPSKATALELGQPSCRRRAQQTGRGGERARAPRRHAHLERLSGRPSRGGTRPRSAIPRPSSPAPPPAATGHRARWAALTNPFGLRFKRFESMHSRGAPPRHELTRPVIRAD